MIGQKQFTGKHVGQSVTEFALVLPILLFLLLGVFELGRIVFIFSAVNNASREAARFGASTGTTTGGVVRYLNCDAIRQAARETAFLSGLQDTDIEIGYDEPDVISGTMRLYGRCTGSVARDTATNAPLTSSDVIQGDRIVVTVTRQIDPILPFLPGFSPTFVTARTILKDIAIGPPECRDGADNDNDGNIDYPADDGCESADDTIEALCYRLSVVARPEDAGTMSLDPGTNCSNRYIEETQVNLQAYRDIRNTGFYTDSAYTFDYWEGPVNSGSGSTTNPAVVTMDAEKSIIAHFRLLRAELGVTKTGSPNPVDAGGTLTYEIQVTNNITSPDTAHLVVITDTLPAGVDFQPPAVPDICIEVVTDSVIRCELPNLAPGTSETVSLDVLVPVINGSPQILTNTVTVKGFEFDSIQSNNTFTETVTLRPAADIWVQSKEANPDPTEADTPFTYAITLVNLGPSVATNVEITDILPARVRFVSSTDNCTASSPDPGSTVTCSIPTMGVGVPITVEFVAEAEPGTTEQIVNHASASADEHDPIPGNNDATNIAGDEDTTVLSADVAIDKRMVGTPVRDQPYTYYLDVRNNGPSSAPSVVVTEQLWAGVDFVSVSSPACDPPDASGIIDCALGELASGALTTIEITVVPTVEGTLTATTAQVSSSRADHDTSNNSDTEPLTVVALVGLSIEKTGPTSVNHGAQIIYSIDVANAAGQSTATNVEVTDTLPTGNFTYIGPANATGWTCPQPANGEVVCSRDTALAAGTGDSFDIVIEPQEPGIFRNSATVTSAEDPTGANDSHSTSVEPVVGLTFSKSASPSPPHLGGPLAYTIDVYNEGPSDATNVSIVDPLPPEVDFVSTSIIEVSSTGWICNYETTLRRVTCTPPNGTLAAGSGATITIDVVVNSTVLGGTINNTATLSSAEDERTASTFTVVDPPPDLSTSVSAPATGTVGTPFDYVLTVTNLGPSPATNLTVTSQLDPSVTFGSVTVTSGNGWTCTDGSATQPVVCEATSLSAGAQAVFTITVTPTTAATVYSEGVVTAMESDYDPNRDNDSASQPTIVSAQ